MNRIVFIFLLIISSTRIYSLPLVQVNNTRPINEKVTLFTDRNLYAEGEIIQFAAHIGNNEDSASLVLYVELISDTGNQIVGKKFKVEKQFAKGSIKIPDQIPSGSYFIKAYTRWMRNFDPSEYSYTQVLIFNAKEDFIVSNRLEQNEKTINFAPVDTSINSISISTDKNIYSPREKALLKFNIDSKYIKWLTLTITPKASLINKISKSENNPEANKQFYYDAEAKGFTLSAKVINAETNTPAPHNLVNVSILGPVPDFLASRTDSTGSFSVCLPEKYGNYDLYIGVEEGLNSNVKFDNDFCPRRVNITPPVLKPTQEQLASARNIVNNKLINQHFYKLLKDSAGTEIDAKEAITPFYGTPDINFVFKDYVDLLSVREYFYELLPVSVKETESQLYFRVFGNYPEFDIYKPLILVDNIVIDDARRILSAKPEFLDRVEIITKPYYKGDMVYAGIISFYSKAGDFARIELSRSDMFITYKFFSKPHSYQPQTIESNKPDTRNTLLWDGRLNFKLDKLEYNITIPDTKGDYTILLRGVDVYGKTISNSSVFTVR